MNNLRRRVFVPVSSELPQGIYAYYSNGSIKQYDEADQTAVGVAVITSNCSFVVSKSAITDSVFGGSGANYTNVGSTCSASQDVIINDFDGEGNTEKIISYFSGYTDWQGVKGSPITESCKAAFDGNGYMGSFGEWYEVYNNISSVSAMMTKIGAVGWNTRPLTSTFKSSNRIHAINLTNGLSDERNATQKNYTFAFCKI